MTDNNRIKSIALVGASGNIGTPLLHALLTSNQFSHITIITRSESKSTFSHFPPSEKTTITIRQGSYSDPAFLSSAFQGHDAAIFALNFMAMGVQGEMIEAAAKAGVKWILPTEYAGDGLNEGMVEAVPLFWPKREARKQIEELGKGGEGREGCEGVKWVGVATGPWLEASIQRSLFALSPSSRTATLYPDAGPFNTTTLPHAALSIARLLALPITNPSNPRASLSHYANNFLYTSSFHTTQEEIFETLKRATGTEEGDWKVDRSKTIEEWAGVCREGMKRGDMRLGAGLAFVAYMGKGRGGDVESKAKEDREVLGLVEEEGFDEVVARAVKAGEPAALEFKN